MVLRMPCRRWLASERSDRLVVPVLWRGSKQERNPHIGVPVAAFASVPRGCSCSSLESTHIRGAHGCGDRPRRTSPRDASARADRCQRDRLLKFAAPFVPRVWAVEGATGVGALLAQQLV